MKKFDPISEGFYPVENLAIGTLVRRTDSPTAPVWVVGEYDRTTRRYSLHKWEDVNAESFAKKGRKFYAGFTF